MKHDNVIMSAEHFSWIFQKKVLEELHTELKKHFEEIKIIVYLRRQDEHIISHHQQGSKSARSPEAKFYGNQPRAIPEKTLSLHSYYLDYHQKLSLWKDVFGKNNLIVRVFDKNKLINNDIVSDFFSILGIPAPSVDALRLNESNGFEKTKVSHMLNEHIEDKKLMNFIKEYLDNEGKLVPSKAKALQYYQFFEESNKQLEKEFNIKFDENFDKYPQKDMDVWDEESANRAISNILLAMNDYSKKSLFTRIRIYIKKLRDLIKKSQAEA